MLRRAEVSPSGSSSWPRCRQVFGKSRSPSPADSSRTSRQDTSPTADGALGDRLGPGRGQQVLRPAQAGPARGEQVAHAPSRAPRRRCRPRRAASASARPRSARRGARLRAGPGAGPSSRAPPGAPRVRCREWAAVTRRVAPRRRRTSRGDPGGDGGAAWTGSGWPTRAWPTWRRRSASARRWSSTTSAPRTTLVAEAFALRRREGPGTTGDGGDRATTRWSGCAGCCASTGPPGQALGWRLWIDAWALAQREPHIRTVLRRMDQRWQAMLREVVDDGVAAGRFRCPDPEGAVGRLSALRRRAVRGGRRAPHGHPHPAARVGGPAGQPRAGRGRRDADLKSASQTSQWVE